MTAQDPPAAPPPAAAGASVTATSQRLVTDLVRRCDHAATYLLIDGRLRCTAADSPFPVPDGVVPGAGAAGRAVTTGRTVACDLPDDDVEGHAPARVCAPVVVDGTPVGGVELASRSSLSAEAVARAEAAATELAGAVSRSGGSVAAPLGQRLARVAAEVAGAGDTERLVRVVLEGATVLTGRSTAALAAGSPDGRWRLSSATGSLAPAVSGWEPADVAALAAHVPVPASVHLSCRPDGPPELGFAAACGAACVSASPLVVAGELTGLLVLVDAGARQLDPVGAAAVEVLAALAAAGLRSAGLLADLADRARQALGAVRTVEDFRDDLTGFCVDAIRSGEVTRTCMRLRPYVAGTASAGTASAGTASAGTEPLGAGDRTVSALVEAVTGQLRHGDTLYRLDGSDLAVLLATGEPQSAGAVAARLARAARDAGAPVTLGWALVDGPPAAVVAATDRSLDDAARG